MATNLPLSPLAHFDTVAIEISETFDPLIAQLIARRDALLYKLFQLREDYTNKETTRQAAIQELEQTQQKLLRMDLKVNTNIPIHKKATELYQQGLQDLLTPTQIPYPLFQSPTLQTLQIIFSEFGEVFVREIPDYSNKLEPTLTAGKKGDMGTSGLSIDEKSKHIYLADPCNSRIQVVSFDGKLLTSFGQQILQSPYSIAVAEEDIFVTDTGHHSLFQFHKKDLKLKNRTGTKGTEDGNLNGPNGLSIDANGDVLVADCLNNRIAIFSQTLQFKKCIGTEQLRYPRDVKLTKECVVVLDWNANCVHFYSRKGTLLSSCISQGEEHDCLVKGPLFFCLDPADNIIISDNRHHAIKVFSKDGQHRHTIGRRGHKMGEFHYPFGVSISRMGAIFVVSSNPNYTLQCF